MPLYDFECTQCQLQFEVRCGMSEIIGFKPECPKCLQKGHVGRVYSDILVSVPKTLGSLVDKNSDKMSDDNKEFLTKKHNSYRNKDYSGPLPKGMRNFQRDHNGNRI